MQLDKAKSRNSFLENLSEGTLYDWLILLLSKWKLFIIVAFLGGVLGLVQAYLSKPKYESRLTFALDDGAGSDELSGALNLAAQFGLSIGNGQSLFSGDNIQQIIVSRRVIENVLLATDTFNGKPFTYLEYYLNISGDRKLFDKKPYLQKVHYYPGIPKSKYTYLQDSILYNTYLLFNKKLINVDKTDKLLNIYEVKVTTSEEVFTKKFTDKLIDETNKYYTEICSKKSREIVDILQERADAMKGNLGNSLVRKAATQDANLNAAFAAAQAPVMKQEFNVRAYGEAYAEIFKNLELARFQYLKKIPLMQIIDKADYPMKKIKVSKFKNSIIFSIFSLLLVVFFLWGLRLYFLAKIELSRKSLNQLP